MKFTQANLPLASLALLTATSCSTYQKSEVSQSFKQPTNLCNLVQYANPMCGTGTRPGVAAGGINGNNAFPGAVAPFGMIQWSPDTGNGRHLSGYGDEGKRISDFSVDHISGTGCPYGEDFAMVPILGNTPSAPPAKRSAYAQPFSHTNETARPGYYGVTFDNGLKVELTTTVRSGFGRFIYPGRKAATLMINAASDIQGSAASGINIDPATREIRAWSVGGHFCGTSEVRTIYFYAVFNRPFQAWSTWADNTVTKDATNASGTTSGAFITFKTGKDRTVLAKVGISYVSTANAKANVEAESPLSEFTSRDFGKAVKAASEVWNRWLNKIQVSGGTRDEKETFYSMLYHALLGPEVVSDVNGQYTGYDGKVHTVPEGHEQYGIFSGWDIYRSECQLLAMIAPQEASDMAQSLLADYQQDGAFPLWGVIKGDSGVMIGDPSAPMIADFYAFGATNFDANAALAGLVRAATDPSVRSFRTKALERPALREYLRYGYVPEHQEGDYPTVVPTPNNRDYGNVSMTLEYASADFALSQFAQALGDDTNSAMLLHEAQNWQNLFNTNTGYLQMRRRDGSWASGFTNNVLSYDNDQAFVEGTAGQYVWMVPFNYKTLFKLMGGPLVAAKRLDAFFTKLNVGDHGPDAWMAWLGNEPCLETPWIYDFLGQPYKTQDVVRRAITELYSSKPGAYPGNDDVGEMSSWYIFAALGLYPEIPGTDVLVLGSPLFPKTVLHLQHGDVTIIGHNAAKDAPYVQSLTVNGKTWNRPWIRYTDIAKGGTLVYDLGVTANTNWGNNLAKAPPSFSDGH